MSDYTFETLQEFASESRRAFEAKSIARPLIRRLYEMYNPSFERVDEYLDFIADKFPHNYCDQAALYMQYQLKEGKVIEGQYLQHDHTFLKVGAFILDITADQFGGPPVYVGPLQEPWQDKGY